MEKAKYIEKKETILLNELESVHKKIKEISNWYLLSDYKCNIQDKENQMLYAQKLNNIFYEMRELLLTTKNMKLAENLKEIIANDNYEKFDSPEELKQFITDK